MYRLLLASVIATGLAGAADPQMLNLVTPEAEVIAGANFQRISKTRFGEQVFSFFASSEEGFESFKSATGFDPLRDIEEMLIAMPAGSTHREGMLIVRGRYDLDRAARFLATMSNVKKESFQGTDMYLPSDMDGPKAFAFLSSSLAVAGDQEHVRNAIKKQSANTLDAALSAKAIELSGSQDAWVVTKNPSALAAGLSDRRVQGAVKGDLTKSIERSSGGIVFGEIARFRGEAVMKNEQDATSMADVVKFLFNLMQAGGPKGTLTEFIGSVRDFNATSSGNTVNVSFSVPESQLQNLLSKRKLTAVR